jgi:hypothetical protein
MKSETNAETGSQRRGHRRLTRTSTRHGDLVGVHFVNLTVRRTSDPIKPNVLIYEPVS